MYIVQKNEGAKLTVKVPSRDNVGSGPAEQINRIMMVTISVRIPAGFGKVIAMAADKSMTAQISPDRWGPGSVCWFVCFATPQRNKSTVKKIQQTNRQVMSELAVYLVIGLKMDRRMQRSDSLWRPRWTESDSTSPCDCSPKRVQVDLDEKKRKKKNSSNEIIAAKKYSRTTANFTSKFLLPFHFVEHVFGMFKKFGYFRALFVAFGRVENANLGVASQVLAHFRYICSIVRSCRTICSHSSQPAEVYTYGNITKSGNRNDKSTGHYLDLSRVVGIELERLVRFRVTAVGRLLHRRQFFVVLSQLVAQNVNVVSNLKKSNRPNQK